MELPVNRFKRAIKSGHLQVGLWHSLASHIVVEALSGSGFDWLLLDTEHAPNNLPMVYSQLQAAASGGSTHPIVRVPWNDAIMIKGYLDAGVQTLLIPMVQTQEEARHAVAATRYPPGGIRGFASASRSSRFGRVKDYHARCAEEICVVVQIENQIGLDNLEGIARTEGVDGILIGPGDLAAALGHLGDQDHSDIHRVIEDATKRIKACGSAPGILTGNDALIRRVIELGCVFPAVGSDIGILTKGSEQLAQKYKQRK